MFDVARLLGDSLREVKTPRRPVPDAEQHRLVARTFIVGGQIRGEPPRLFNVYSEGNFIEATPDTCYFQIGETKYGKPIIDRVITRRTIAASTRPSARWSRSTRRCARTSRSGCRSTCWSTRPIRCGSKLQRRIDEADPYFQMVHTPVGRGAAPRVRAAAEPRLDCERALMAIRVAPPAPHDVSLRPARRPGAARDPAAARAALPHADARLFAQRRAGAAFPQLAAGPVRQLGRAARVPRARRRARDRRRPRRPT